MKQNEKTRSNFEMGDHSDQMSIVEVRFIVFAQKEDPLKVL